VKGQRIYKYYLDDGQLAMVVTDRMMKGDPNGYAQRANELGCVCRELVRSDVYVATQEFVEPAKSARDTTYRTLLYIAAWHKRMFPRHFVQTTAWALGRGE